MIVLIFQNNEAKIRDGLFWKHSFSNSVYKGESTSITCSMKIMHTLSLVECNLFDLEITE